MPEPQWFEALGPPGQVFGVLVEPTLVSPTRSVDGCAHSADLLAAPPFFRARSDRVVFRPRLYFDLEVEVLQEVVGNVDPESHESVERDFVASFGVFRMPVASWEAQLLERRRVASPLSFPGLQRTSNELARAQFLHAARPGQGFQPALGGKARSSPRAAASLP